MLNQVGFVHDARSMAGDQKAEVSQENGDVDQSADDVEPGKLCQAAAVAATVVVHVLGAPPDQEEENVQNNVGQHEVEAVDEENVGFGQIRNATNKREKSNHVVKLIFGYE